MACSFGLKSPSFHGVVALQRQASTSAEWANVAACAPRMKCDVFNDVTPAAPRLTAQPHARSHPHALSSRRARIFVHLAGMQTRDAAVAAALPRLQILTDGDVEAVNAEGGTPTLPETMLLGVRFHRLDTPVTLEPF